MLKKFFTESQSMLSCKGPEGSSSPTPGSPQDYFAVFLCRALQFKFELANTGEQLQIKCTLKLRVTR